MQNRKRRLMYPSVKRMQQRVPCPVSDTAASVSLAPFSILQALTTKSSLVDLSIFSTTERHAKVFQLGRQHNTRLLFWMLKLTV